MSEASSDLGARPMNDQSLPKAETPDRVPAREIQIGWGFWTLWVSALAATGAMSYLVAAEAPLAERIGHRSGTASRVPQCRAVSSHRV